MAEVGPAVGKKDPLTRADTRLSLLRFVETQPTWYFIRSTTKAGVPRMGDVVDILNTLRVNHVATEEGVRSMGGDQSRNPCWFGRPGAPLRARSDAR